jgi:hypothetical protein
MEVNMKIETKTCMVLWLIAGLLFCNEAYGVGETGAQFLKIGVGARACAMGEAFAGIADDPSAIYWNPAGISQMNSAEATAMQNFWLLDMSYQYLAGTFPSHFGNLGVSIAYSSSGNIPKYENFQKVGEYSAYDMAGTVAYAKNIGEWISSGISLKFIQQKIENENATGFAVDLGLLYKADFIQGMRFGFAVQNFGTKIKFIEQADPLPLNVKGGIAYTKGPLTLAGDLNKPRDNNLRVNIGAEFLIKAILALRGGYNSANSYSAGLGVTWRKLSFDYAFVPYKDTDNSHRISVTVKF